MDLWCGYVFLQLHEVIAQLLAGVALHRPRVFFWGSIEVNKKKVSDWLESGLKATAKVLIFTVELSDLAFGRSETFGNLTQLWKIAVFVGRSNHL